MRTTSSLLEFADPSGGRIGRHELLANHSKPSPTAAVNGLVLGRAGRVGSGSGAECGYEIGPGAPGRLAEDGGGADAAASKAAA